MLHHETRPAMMRARGSETMLTDDAVGVIADRVLREALRDNGYVRVDVRGGVDHEGEPALFVDAVLGENIPPVPGAVINSALLALRQALFGSDESRFPYLRMVHPDDIYAEGVTPRVARDRSRRDHG